MPRVEDVEHRVEELLGPLVAEVLGQEATTAEVLAGELVPGRHDVPRRPTPRQVVEGGELAGDLVRLVERRVDRAGETETVGDGGEGGEDRERVGPADDVEVVDPTTVLAQAQALGEEQEVELGPLRRLGEVDERRQLDVAARPVGRSTPWCCSPRGSGPRGGSASGAGSSSLSVAGGVGEVRADGRYTINSVKITRIGRGSRLHDGRHPACRARSGAARRRRRPRRRRPQRRRPGRRRPRRSATPATGWPSTTSTPACSASPPRWRSASLPGRRRHPARVGRRPDGAPHAAVGGRGVRPARRPVPGPPRPRSRSLARTPPAQADRRGRRRRRPAGRHLRHREARTSGGPGRLRRPRRGPPHRRGRAAAEAVRPDAAWWRRPPSEPAWP